MKINKRKIRITAALLAAVLAASALAGCGKKENNNGAGAAQQENSNGVDATRPEEISGEELENAGGEVVEGEALEEGVPGEDGALKFKPAECGMPRQETYEYPYLGLNAVLSQKLLEKIESYDVLMLNGEDYAADGSLKFAALYWFAPTEEQKQEEVTAFDPQSWIAGLAKIGTLGVYSEEALANIDELSGCSEHKEIGKSEDGKYTYYLSYAEGADESLKKELEKTEVTISKMQEFDRAVSAGVFSEMRQDTDNVGDFQTEDVNGESYTADLFKEYDLTLVNVFATWCSPCVEEMPELQKLKETMAEKGVNVVGMVLDSVTPTGKEDGDAIDKAKLLQEKLGLTFPLLKPDETAMNGRLKGIEGVPESFFVDKDGNIVGETYVGARSFEDWQKIVEQELSNLKGE